MKSGRTKLVIRRLPPSISRPNLFSGIDSRFRNSYNWCSFHPGNETGRNFSTAYINFRSEQDAAEFTNFFNGHIFVTEEGEQFRAEVEFAINQRVPTPALINDYREGTVYEDSEYLEFLKSIVKPYEKPQTNADSKDTRPLQETVKTPVPQNEGKRKGKKPQQVREMKAHLRRNQKTERNVKEVWVVKGSLQQ